MLNSGFYSYFFITQGLALVILFAGLFPILGKKNGLIHSEISVKYVITFLIFLISGISLKTNVLTKVTKEWNKHLFIQLFSFGFIPLFGFGLINLLKLDKHFDINLTFGYYFL